MSEGALRLHWLAVGDERDLVRAGALFDGPVDDGSAAALLARAGHHVCLAYLDDRPVGFVVGVEIAHADRGCELYCDELGVDAPHRNRGIGTALVDALAARAADLGCVGMWVLTEPGNLAARRTYLRAGADDDAESCELYQWTGALSAPRAAR